MGRSRHRLRSVNCPLPPGVEGRRLFSSPRPLGVRMFGFTRPELSVVMVVHRMQREAPRTLYSLTSDYQQGVREDQYKVLVVENASEQMLCAEQVRSYGRHFRYAVYPQPSCSPAAALNFGVPARGRILLLIVDGARILSPGILRHTLLAWQMFHEPVVATLAWHLGPDNQARSIHQGYDQREEDRLLAGCGWEQDGYRLFTVSSLAGSSAQGWFAPILESNCLAVSRTHFRALGGYCEDFQTPGGGFVNLDFYARAVADPQRPLVVLLGEGTFHQFHGGVATNRRDDTPIRQFQDEYLRLRGRPFTAPQTTPTYLGGLRRSLAVRAVGPAPAAPDQPLVIRSMPAPEPVVGRQGRSPRGATAPDENGGGMAANGLESDAGRRWRSQQRRS